MTKPTRIRWFSMERLCEVEDVLDRAEAVSAASTLLNFGCPYVLLTDMTQEAITKADAEEADLRNPMTVGEIVKGELIATEVERLIDGVFKSGKSP